MTLKPVLAAVLTTTLLMGGCSSSAKAQSSSQAFLWKATLETLDFMPLDQVDPFGGVIITDWYANPQVPAERFKATAYILDTNLRADGLKVSIFKQTQTAGGWQGQIENAILTRARQLFIATEDAR